MIKIKNRDLFDFFKINYTGHKSAEIALEKLLKVLLAFYHDGYEAYKKGSNVLKPNSPIYKDFSLKINEYFTIDNMIHLYFTYLKAENQKKENDKRHPIPYYMLSFMGSFFKEKSFEEINNKLDKLFSDKDLFNDVYNFFDKLTNMYSKEYTKQYNADYNVMIKQEIDTGVYRHCLDMLQYIECPENVKWFIEN